MPTETLRKIKWPPAITRLTVHFTCGLMSDLLISKHRKKYGHTWHWVSLLRPGVTSQHKHLGIRKVTYDVQYFTSKHHAVHFLTFPEQIALLALRVDHLYTLLDSHHKVSMVCAMLPSEVLQHYYLLSLKLSSDVTYPQSHIMICLEAA